MVSAWGTGAAINVVRSSVPILAKGLRLLGFNFVSRRKSSSSRSSALIGLFPRAVWEHPHQSRNGTFPRSPSAAHRDCHPHDTAKQTHRCCAECDETWAQPASSLRTVRQATYQVSFAVSLLCLVQALGTASAHGRLWCRAYKAWQLGVALFIVGNMLNFLSFGPFSLNRKGRHAVFCGQNTSSLAVPAAGFAAQSLLAALGSVQFVSNVFFASLVLGEKVSSRGLEIPQLSAV